MDAGNNAENSEARSGSLAETRQEQKQEESRRDVQGDRQEQRDLQRLQVMMQLLLASIAQDASLTVDEAAQMVANTRKAALRMFPDREGAYNLLCRPRIQRAMRERFHIQ